MPGADDPAPVVGPSAPDALARSVRGAGYLVLLLDFDGTLVPLEPVPELAIPDPALRGLLRQLSARPRTAVHLFAALPADALAIGVGPDLRSAPIVWLTSPPRART